MRLMIQSDALMPDATGKESFEIATFEDFKESGFHEVRTVHLNCTVSTVLHVHIVC